MPWYPLEVLEAPRLESMQVKLHPPAYTGLPVEESEKSIHALRGTRVELAGTVTKKIRQATLCQEDGSRLALDVSGDGYRVALAADAAEPLVVDKTGQYWIELEDVDGLVGGADDRWEIRAVADQEPSITIEQPGTNVFVTPQGEVAVKIAVKDDLAIHDVALHFNRSDRTDVEDFAVPLYEGDAQVAPRAEPGLLISGKLGDNRVVEHRWLLADLNLKSGAQLTFWATAADYLPQSGKSTVRKLTIITPGELEQRLAERQSLVVAELRRVLKMQQDARTQTKSLEIQVNEVGRIGKPDVDHAQIAELNQRQVTRTLTSPTEGIPAQVADFLSELRGNRVDSPEVERHMTSILEEVERLGREHLGAIESELTSFIKGAQVKLADEVAKPNGTTATGENLKSSLAAAGQNQDQVISSLEELLGQLGRWDSYRRFARDISQLQRDQEEITKKTKELAPQTLGRDVQRAQRSAAGGFEEAGRPANRLEPPVGEDPAANGRDGPLARRKRSDRRGHDLRRSAPGPAAGHQRPDAQGQRAARKEPARPGGRAASADRAGPRRVALDSLQPPRAGVRAPGQAVARGRGRSGPAPHPTGRLAQEIERSGRDPRSRRA